MASTYVRADAAIIARQISAALTARDLSEPANTARAFRRFIQLADNLAAETGLARHSLTLAEPAPVLDQQGHSSEHPAHWDAAIAALCEYRLNEESLPVPAWIRARAGTPDSPWSPRTSIYDIPADLTQVPPQFLSRGILIEAAALESA